MSRQPGERWDEGIVTGGGDTGAILFGSPAAHRIALSTTRFFLPVNSRRAAPPLAETVPELRSLLLAGRPDLAAISLADALQEVGEDGDLVWTDPLVPCATLVLEIGGGEQALDYGRTVDFESGLARVAWSAGGGTRSIEVLAERGTGHVLVRISGECTLGLAVELGDGGGSHAAGIPAQGYADRVRTVSTVDTDRVDFTIQTTSPSGEPSGCRTVVTADRKGRVDGGALLLDVREGFPLTLDIAVDVPAAAPTAERMDHAVREQRTGQHGQLIRRSAFGLGHAFAGTSTEQLWQKARAGDPDAERAVVELAFAAGRGTIVSSTGDLPPTLQGVWQGTWAPAWSADYTLNGNVQNGAIAALAVTGTPELLLSYFRLLWRHHDDFAANARRLFGARGWLLPARMTTHGRANHFHPEYPHQFWWGSGAWAVRIAWEYFVTTGDLAFARETALPLSREVAAFYRDALTFDDRGLAHLAPSYSPENTPLGSATPLTVDATSEVMMVRDAFMLEARIAALLHETPPAPSPTLPSLRGVGGLLPEWLGEDQPDRVGHRHASHLYDLWYEDPDWISDTALRAGAMEVIRRKLAWRLADPRPTPGHMEMAFGLVQLGLAAARLGSADLALECVLLLARDHWGTNGVSLHDGGAIFNVDASGGLPALTAAMLVDSFPGGVRLFPALPAAWPNGRIEGLHLRGGLRLVALDWSDTEGSATLVAPAETAAARSSDRVDLLVGEGWAIEDRATVWTGDLGPEPTTVRLTRRT